MYKIQEKTNDNNMKNIVVIDVSLVQDQSTKRSGASGKKSFFLLFLYCTGSHSIGLSME